MSTFLPESYVMTATENILRESEIKIYKNIPFCKGKKVSFHEKSSLSVIVDKIKDFFGLESFNRVLVTFPSQEVYVMESHIGYERPLLHEEITDYGVFKVRLFRWILGLPHAMPRNDIIVRHLNGRKFYVSYRDYEIDPDRNMRIDIPPDIDPRKVVSEMLYGVTASILKDSIWKIINSVDPAYIFMADCISRKLNQYGLL